MCSVGFILVLKYFLFTCSFRIVHEVTLSMLLLITVIFSWKWQLQMWIKNSQETTTGLVLKAHTVLRDVCHQFWWNVQKAKKSRLYFVRSAC